MKTLKVNAEPTTCPKCGGKLTPILYGQPTPDTYEAFQRGEVVFGGCCIQVDEHGNVKMPQWVCKKCHIQIALEVDQKE